MKASYGDRLRAAKNHILPAPDLAGAGNVEIAGVNHSCHATQAYQINTRVFSCFGEPETGNA
jgi:hypothetical protein